MRDDRQSEAAGENGGANDALAVREAHERVARGERDVSFDLPARVGSGRFATLASHGGIAAFEHVMSFRAEAEFEGAPDPARITFHFCLGDGVEWRRADGSVRRARTDTLFATGGVRGVEAVRYEPRRAYRFVSLSVPASLAGAPPVDDELSDAPIRSCERALLHDLIRPPVGGRHAGLYRLGKTAELAAMLLDRACAPRRKRAAVCAADRNALEDVRALLDSRFADPPTYPELAAWAHMSETKLSQCFRELFGTSMHAYVVDRRLERARALFEDGADSVARVAAEVGYANPSHFSSAFKRRYGIPPSEACGKRRTHQDQRRPASGVHERIRP